jgi:hypothetical protein
MQLNERRRYILLEPSNKEYQQKSAALMSSLKTGQQLQSHKASPFHLPLRVYWQLAKNLTSIKYRVNLMEDDGTFDIAMDYSSFMQIT